MAALAGQKAETTPTPTTLTAETEALVAQEARAGQ
jgi:hypothetical protein